MNWSLRVIFFLLASTWLLGDDEPSVRRARVSESTVRGLESGTLGLLKLSLDQWLSFYFRGYTFRVETRKIVGIAFVAESGMLEIRFKDQVGICSVSFAMENNVQRDTDLLLASILEMKLPSAQ